MLLSSYMEGLYFYFIKKGLNLTCLYFGTLSFISYTDAVAQNLKYFNSATPILPSTSRKYSQLNILNSVTFSNW